MKSRSLFTLFVFTVYSVLFALVLLFSIGVLPATRQMLHFAAASAATAWLVGYSVEMCLVRPDARGVLVAGPLIVVRAAAYAVPTLLAFHYRLPQWRETLSLFCYVALLVRIVWGMAAARLVSERASARKASTEA